MLIQHLAKVLLRKVITLKKIMKIIISITINRVLCLLTKSLFQIRRLSISKTNIPIIHFSIQSKFE